jgi:cellulose synthase/poly-beta-1,6-N-acetylglucosamine synthase-like glycosyltransferase
MATALILSAGLIVIACLWLRFAKREVSAPVWSTLEIPELTAPASPFVSIVVTVGDRARDLERCVQSLLRQDYARFEVIVVDASAGTETSERLRQIEATAEGACESGEMSHCRPSV